MGLGFFLGLRMVASGWQTLAAPSGNGGDEFTRPEDEHPNRALGLPRHPIIGFIHRQAILEAGSRTPMDFYWSVIFVVVFFAIHVGRLDAEWTWLGMLTPAAATLGDIVAALVTSLVVLFPLELAWPLAPSMTTFHLPAAGFVMVTISSPNGSLSVCGARHCLPVQSIT